MKIQLPKILVGNIIPVIASLFFGWTVKEILLFYIFEFIFTEIISAIQIGVLTYLRERRITSPVGASLAVVLVLGVHLVIFLFILVFLAAISSLGSYPAELNHPVRNPLLPFLEFLKTSYPALLILAGDRLWIFRQNFFRNRLYRKMSSSRFLRLSIIRQCVIFLVALTFAVLFRKGDFSPLFLLILVVILKSTAEGFIHYWQIKTSKTRDGVLIF
jgi:hypothetical protein